jgi:hypothetical protein
MRWRDACPPGFAEIESVYSGYRTAERRASPATSKGGAPPSGGAPFSTPARRQQLKPSVQPWNGSFVQQPVQRLDP